MISQIIAIGLRFKLSYRVFCKRIEKKNSDGGLLTQMQKMWSRVQVVDVNVLGVDWQAYSCS